MQQPPPVTLRPIQAACPPISATSARPRTQCTLQKREEQLNTGLIFCTKVDGCDPSKRVVGLKGSQMQQHSFQPPGDAQRAF